MVMSPPSTELVMSSLADWLKKEVLMCKGVRDDLNFKKVHNIQSQSQQNNMYGVASQGVLADVDTHIHTHRYVSRF